MKRFSQTPLFLVLITFLFPSCVQTHHDVEDWLVDGLSRKAEVEITNDREITLSNGLVQRTFFLGPNLACFDFTNLMTGAQLLRTVMPEARITLDGKTFNIGGLYGQKERAYFKKEWLKDLKASDEDFQYESMKVTEITPHFPTKTNFWTSHQKEATGKMVTFQYSHPAFQGLFVKIHYEIIDDLPVIAKYLTIKNSSKNPIEINQVVNEVLGLVEEESAVVGSTEKMKKPHQLYIENNFAFNNAMHAELSSQATHWKPDPDYTSQVNYDLLSPSIMEVYPEEGVGIMLHPGENFKSIRTYELILDSYDRERNGLARRKMYRAIAPWVLQNPIFMHLVSKNDEEVRTAIDQCVDTGYEALILSFGSHINMEDNSDANIQRWNALADYAHKRGVKIGGYSLFSSRTISPEHDVISRFTGKPGGAFFGNAPCLASHWGLDYLDKLKYFFEKTGFDIFENDGPYPGDVCASTSHPGHKGLHDSQWVQFQLQKELYQWMNARGIYINAPDWYFLDGTHKIALGYREVNFSLPRVQQKILNRQNIYDGTWEKTPSMGWGFVPLTAYHGGGKDAVLEPLSEHLEDYRQLMMQYYGAGVQACYRGPRLYDTQETKEVVIEVIDWYKKYRKILNADIIRLRRADGRDWDGWMHVDPQGKEKGLVMLFNPTQDEMEKELVLPLYYTGLQNKVKVSHEGKMSKTYQLNHNQDLPIKIKILADSFTWLVLE